jgi:hypothetical protein
MVTKTVAEIVSGIECHQASGHIECEACGSIISTHAWDLSLDVDIADGEVFNASVGCPVCGRSRPIGYLTTKSHRVALICDHA